MRPIDGSAGLGKKEKDCCAWLMSLEKRIQHHFPERFAVGTLFEARGKRGSRTPYYTFSKRSEVDNLASGRPCNYLQGI